MAVTTVVLFQSFFLLNCRSLRGSIFKTGFFSNPSVFVGIGVLVLLQLAFIYLPPLQRIFGTAALEWDALLLSALMGTIVMPVVAFEKWVSSRRGKAAQGRPGPAGSASR
jgi:Ca2+-transporting ATPase